ncbi:MAG: hypothetical protein ACE37H_01380 [Phycisphaeraceae bacterium]
MHGKRYVIQMSPVRTGSTLVYNLLRRVLSDKTVIKDHKYRIAFGHLPIVATVRDPFDAIASIIRVNNLGNDQPGVEQACHIFRHHGADDIVRIRNKPNVLILKYEVFIDSYDYIFSELERFMGISIAEDLKSELIGEFDIDNAKKIARHNDRFGEYDSETLIHGGHISERAKQAGYAVQMFSEQQIDAIVKAMPGYIQAFGYRV